MSNVTSLKPILDKKMTKIDPRMSVAPMMNWTDRHCRVFHRLLSRNTLLYSEMITSGAIIHGNRQSLLKFTEIEHPVALQLGGSDPKQLSEASKIGIDFGYDEINLNIGCPSDRVQSGCFGAILMKQPSLVSECISQMKKGVGNKKVTIKCRLGVDNQDPEHILPEFVKHLLEAGVDGVIIHARKAILDGLSPKQNREIPPLKYDLVSKIKYKFPKAEIVINGGIGNLKLANAFLKEGLDGVMIGRAAYNNPHDILLRADEVIFKEKVLKKSMKSVILEFCGYIEKELGQGTRLNEMTRHILGAFNGFSGARSFRQTLSEKAHRSGAGTEVVVAAVDKVTDDNPVYTQVKR